MSKKRSTNTSRKHANVATYDVDIGQEFKDVKHAISGLKQEIFAWRDVVDSQLTKLNSNMEKVLSQIADHEGRITKLEAYALKTATKKETISEFAKFGWWAAKALISAGIIIGSILGTAGAWKLIFPT